VVTLSASETLLIPRFWLHAVLSLEESVSVNVFASNCLEMLTFGGKRLVLAGLHAVGLVGRRGCVCCDDGAR
jgi:hypothetical protein